jgi:pimeloyl-ACP methyl ester carboxylesterase
MVLHLGHSHGGRIALLLAHRQDTGITLPFAIEHTVLCAAAGIRHKRHLKRLFGIALAKTGKYILRVPGIRALSPIGRKLLYKLVRVHDYERASAVMQQTLQLVTKQDLSPLLPTITTRTTIFWGTKDTYTPYSDGILMERTMPNATLHTYTNVRHAVHRAAAEDIAEVLVG